METLKKYKDFIQRQKWVNAKTFIRFAPHEYILKNNLVEEDQRIFEDFVIFIRENGYKEKFGSRTYTYYNLSKKKYWTMGSPLKKTIIINRANI